MLPKASPVLNFSSSTIGILNVSLNIHIVLIVLHLFFSLLQLPLKCNSAAPHASVVETFLEASVESKTVELLSNRNSKTIQNDAFNSLTLTCPPTSTTTTSKGDAEDNSLISFSPTVSKNADRENKVNDWSLNFMEMQSVEKSIKVEEPLISAPVTETHQRKVISTESNIFADVDPFSKTKVAQSNTNSSSVLAFNISAEAKETNTNSKSISLKTSVMETLTVVERGSQVEKVELLGTVYASLAGTGGSDIESGPVDIVVQDPETLLKSLILSKNVKRTGPPSEAQQLFVTGSSLQVVKGVILPPCPPVSGAAGSQQDSLGVPLLRYSCIDEFKPILLKARNQLALSALPADGEGQQGALGRTRSQIKLSVQVVCNPKFSFPLSDFTVQVSLSSLQLKRRTDNTPLGNASANALCPVDHPLPSSQRSS